MKLGPFSLTVTPPIAPGFAEAATLHTYTPLEMPMQPGNLFSVYRRTDLYTQAHVANVLLMGDGIRIARAMEGICRALDDELKTRTSAPERA